jgi:hypothetical protein
VTIGIKEVLGLGFAPGLMELLLVEHERYLMRLKLHLKHLQSLRILTVQKAVPGVAGPRVLIDVAPIRRAFENPDIAQIIGKNQIRRRQFVG